MSNEDETRARSWGSADQGTRGEAPAIVGRTQSPLEQAQAENDALRERIRALQSLGAMEEENRQLRRQVRQVDEIMAAFEALWEERPTEPPTQEQVAERLGLDKRELQRRLKPYPGLWKHLTASQD